MHASTPQELLPDAIDFAGFRLDSVRAELTREGQVVPLRPKVYRLLSYLAAHAGRTVPKRELLGAVWPDVVVTDDSLSQCIGELRAALGDSAQSLVKTVPRLGYRFDAPVVAGSQALVAPTDLSGSSTDDDSAPHQPRRRRTRWSLGIGVMAIAALCLGPATLRPTPLGIDAALALGRSVTVIAFADLSEPQAPHFAEGITQEIVTDLGSLQDATVVSSGPLGAGTSIAAIDIQRIGRELGVRHVLTGSVRREGERVQIQVQMSRTDTAGLEWSQRFDYPNVVDWNWRADISQRVAASLDARLLDSAVLLAWQDARSSAATDEWMRGSYLLQRYTTRAELLQARGHFEAALAADPRSINALSDLAGTYINEVIGRWAPDRHAALDKAKEYARRAIALDARRAPARDHEFGAVAVPLRGPEIDDDAVRNRMRVGGAVRDEREPPQPDNAGLAHVAVIVDEYELPGPRTKHRRCQCIRCRGVPAGWWLRLQRSELGAIGLGLACEHRSHRSQPEQERAASQRAPPDRNDVHDEPS